MQNGIRRTAHGNIERHGIKKCIACSNGTWQNTFVAIAVVFICIVDHLFGRFFEQFQTISVRCNNGAVAWKCQTNGFVEAVHRVGSKHTRARTTGWTSRIFDARNLFIRYRVVGSLYHGIYQVEMLTIELASFHWAARNKNRWDI